MKKLSKPRKSVSIVLEKIGRPRKMLKMPVNHGPLLGLHSLPITA